MKKKNLKTLSLKKASVSKLNGGSNVPTPIQLTRNLLECIQTRDIRQCTWYSELLTACECPPSWDFRCQQSIDIPCEA
ncbi:hypothetical protein H2O64_05665 [Kordia sp. YSTF-M3]|uniref:Uncharacterized protein n=1 Tax=Kordia aestuariivivens TaxID=2759037 RepID=A0ABR7Q6G4_9FLAO|nr:hypothetical protein [Kordia aestuariivivens]MBC8754149.1 hypothetical protein [Kordia aestuariivivens]